MPLVVLMTLAGSKSSDGGVSELLWDSRDTRYAQVLLLEKGVILYDYCVLCGQRASA